jgi:hypothetical protein
VDVICADHQGDDEKLGYTEWHLKAAESHKKGGRQAQCGECSRWPTPPSRRKGGRREQV